MCGAGELGCVCGCGCGELEEGEGWLDIEGATRLDVVMSGGGGCCQAGWSKAALAQNISFSLYT